MTLLQSLKGASIAALALSAAAPALAQDATSLASCPARQPVLRVSSLFAQEEFSPHPVQTRFSSPSYSRLYLTPLFSADPWEEKVDAKYGVAESWTFMPGAKGMEIRLRKGLTFNNGEPITARDVVFSIKLFSSDFAEDQIRASLRGIGLQERLREIAFEPPQAFNRDHDTGNVTNTLTLGGASEERYGAPYLLMHRADLHEGIAATVPAERVHLPPPTGRPLPEIGRAHV